MEERVKDQESRNKIIQGELIELHEEQQGVMERKR